MSHLVDHLFLLVSMTISMVGWLIAFIGAIVFNRGLTGGSWWILVYELLLISCISIILLTNTFLHYRLMILTFLGVSISLSIYQLDYVLPTNKFPSSYQSGAGAYAAGYILIMIIQFLWIIVFGSEPDSYVGKYVPNFSNNAIGVIQQQSTQPIETMMEKGNSSVVLSTTTPINTTEYKEKVQALHTYKANQDDPNEIGFSKGEILEIVDRNGNWWQARKSDGTVGIIPSNYFGPSL